MKKKLYTCVRAIFVYAQGGCKLDFWLDKNNDKAMIVYMNDTSFQWRSLELVKGTD